MTHFHRTKTYPLLATRRKTASEQVGYVISVRIIIRRKKKEKEKKKEEKKEKTVSHKQKQIDLKQS